MKKVLIILTTLMVAFALTACAKDSKSADKKEDTTKEVATVTESKFKQFENGLTEKGLTYELLSKSAAMIGAKEGYGYKFADGTITEIYQFDIASAEYKDIKANNRVMLKELNMGIPVTIKDDMVIMVGDAGANKDKVLEIFNSLK